MSEYQYYDFRAIDKPLTPKQRADVASLSSRANVTAQRAEFVYHYGDFRGNEKALIGDTFDMMLYVANWGTRRLMFRLPKTLFNLAEMRDYFISDEMEHDQQGEYVILDLNFNDEGGGGDWIDGEGLLDDLLPLRDELVEGDFRVLYLAWLKAAGKALDEGYIDENTLEPAVPAGLDTLSPAQQQFANLIELDSLQIKVAAEKANAQPTRRRFLDLQTRYEERQEAATREAQRQAVLKAEEKRREAEQQRQHYLDQLSQRETIVWREVYSLVEASNAKSYEQATRHLCDLRELAERQHTLATFTPKLTALIEQYSRRPALIQRLRGRQLI